MSDAPPRLSIRTQLEYEFDQATDILLQVEAAIIPEQRVEQAHIALSPTEHFARVPGHDHIGERIWLRRKGRLSVDYTATVAVGRMTGNLSALDAVPPHLLPGETIEYLLPSRYCPSDQFEAHVEDTFGELCGGARVMAIHDWIASHVRYVSGSSTASTGALESFLCRQGVCRDFAHLMISLVRASAIPARFVSAYALGVEPQDFHAVAEVFLGGAWYLVDATGMAQPNEIAKIGVGRDAADVSFLTSFGQAAFVRQSVSVEPAR